MRGPLKALRAITRLREAGPHPAATPVLQAWTRLPAWTRAEEPQPDTTTLCHGDLHLGQLVRHPAPDGPWLLIDVDDMGVGVPAWDLARPAAWYACGLLPPDEWARFLNAYRAAGGPAVPATGDPWPALDIPARALTVQTAALAVVKAVAETAHWTRWSLRSWTRVTEWVPYHPSWPPDARSRVQPTGVGRSLSWGNTKMYRRARS